MKHGISSHAVCRPVPALTSRIGAGSGTPFHMESRAADLERGGLTPADAERQARLEFGGLEGYKEGCRDASGFRPFDELKRRSPLCLPDLAPKRGLHAMTVLSLALGIGVNLSIFVSLYYVVLHPLPYPNSTGIMAVSEIRAKAPSERNPVAPADYLDWKQDQPFVREPGCLSGLGCEPYRNRPPGPYPGSPRPAEFFDALGMQPVRGRTFSAAECEPGKDSVAVVSYGFWQARLASQTGRYRRDPFSRRPQVHDHRRDARRVQSATFV